MGEGNEVDLVSVAEAAGILGCSNVDVYRLINEESLVVYRVDLVVHLARHDIEALKPRLG